MGLLPASSFCRHVQIAVITWLIFTGNFAQNNKGGIASHIQKVTTCKHIVQ